MRIGSWALLAGRLLFGGFFLFSAYNHFTSTDMLAAFAATKGVPLPRLATLGTGLLLLLGGASILLGAWPRVGLALVALFLVGVTPVMHDFWAIADPQASSAQLANFTRNLALLGASLALLAVPTPWPWSLDSARLHRRATGMREGRVRRPHP